MPKFNSVNFEKLRDNLVNFESLGIGLKLKTE